ncbi:hypothetical protein ACFFJB_14830 [Camelimonas abortus]|uniref:Uncharacterized protein n=1 Tax=Camelimonas abortus TaxID=1017184 RepID=A0ABV7LHN2_9HYPH
MNWHNDRLCCELLILPIMVYDFAQSQYPIQRTDEERHYTRGVLNGCYFAVWELIEHLDHKRAEKLLNRAMRVCRQIAVELNNRPGARIGMTHYYLIEELLSSGTIELCAGSAFGDALEVLLTGVQEHFAKEKLDAAAQKSARKLLDMLRDQHGFYREHFAKRIAA